MCGRGIVVLLDGSCRYIEWQTPFLEQPAAAVAMADQAIQPDVPADFSGVVRLFPLPNFVMFPGVVNPFHIFEKRYRRMLEDALADDRLIAMATLEPGWESDYEGRPPISAAICVGRVVAETRLDNGRFNILLAGICRAAIRQELPVEEPYRMAKVELLPDTYPPAGTVARASLKHSLITRFHSLLPATPFAEKQFAQLVGREIPFGTFVDIVTFTLQIEHGVKLQLLGEPNVDRRAEILLAHLDDAEPATPPSDIPSWRAFPPDFSNN